MSNKYVCACIGLQNYFHYQEIIFWVINEIVDLTFRYEYNGANVSFTYDNRTCWERNRVHAVHDLPDLRQLQILHKVIVEDSSLDQLARP